MINIRKLRVYSYSIGSFTYILTLKASKSVNTVKCNMKNCNSSLQWRPFWKWPPFCLPLWILSRNLVFNGFLNIDIDTKNLKISQCSEVLDSKLWSVVSQGGHFENGGHFVRHFECLAGQRYFSKQVGILSLNAKFHACFTKCTIFIENWLNLPSYFRIVNFDSDNTLVST